MHPYDRMILNGEYESEIDSDDDTGDDEDSQDSCYYEVEDSVPQLLRPPKRPQESSHEPVPKRPCGGPRKDAETQCQPASSDGSLEAARSCEISSSRRVVPSAPTVSSEVGSSSLDAVPSVQRTSAGLSSNLPVSPGNAPGQSAPDSFGVSAQRASVEKPAVAAQDKDSSVADATESHQPVSVAVAAARETSDAPPSEQARSDEPGSTDAGSCERPTSTNTLESEAALKENTQREKKGRVVRCSVCRRKFRDYNYPLHVVHCKARHQMATWPSNGFDHAQ